MLKERATLLTNTVRIFDLILVYLSFLFAYYIRFSHLDFFDQMFSFIYGSGTLPLKERAPYSIFSPEFPYVILSGLVLAVWSIFFNAFRCYKPMRLDRVSDVIKRFLGAHFFASLFLLALLFLQKGEIFSRIFVALFILVSGALIISEKIILKVLLKKGRIKGFNFRRVLIIGTEESAVRATRLIEEHPEIGWYIIGYLRAHKESIGSEVVKEKIIGDLGDLKGILEVEEIDEVIFAISPNNVKDFDDLLWSCEEVGIEARLIMDYFGGRFAKIVNDDFLGIPSLIFSTTPTNLFHLAIKRGIDTVVSAVMLFVLTPILAIIALAIKVESPGPIFFKQIRVGLNGRKFNCLKFRSMVKNAESLRGSLETINEQKGPVFKIRKDPRITQVGKILRKFSLDELPQLINILRGEMSLVGIRPPLPSEVQKYDRWQRRRLSMKPGITCLWQINGRNKVSFEEWMKMDLTYIDNWSLKLDFSILLKTFPAVLRGTGQ